MNGAIRPLPQYAFMTWCLVKKHRDNFTTFQSCMVSLTAVQQEIAFSLHVFDKPSTI